jgi:CMP-N,N'-diacetyllegionaminic acid synthase
LLALIPARGGSKGLPGKNIRSLLGKPMIAYTVEAARQAGLFSDIWVSTDSPEIAAAAKEAGAMVPFLRPANLATDQSPARDTYVHALNEASRLGIDCAEFCALLPTSPLRNAEHIRQAERLFRERAADSVISMTLNPKPPEWLKCLDESRRILPAPFATGPAERNRQEMHNYYVPNGALYFFRTDFFRASESYFGANSFGFVMSRAHSIDVDDELDFRLAQILMQEKF